MKKLKKLTAVMMILIMGISTIVCGNTIKSYASTAQFTISLSSSTVKKGSTVKVTVKLSCSEAIGAYTYCLTYDSSILEYSSGDGSGGGGTIKCAGYGDGSSTSASNSFTFNAIGTGSSYVGTSSAEVYSWSESLCSASNAGATVSVTATGSSGSTTENTTSSTEQNTTTTESTGDTESTDTSETTEETTEELLSDNCLLASLEISPGELTPEFSSDVYSYETTVSSDVTSLAINAIADDAGATVSITGNANFEPGETYHITITVTAETGDNNIYELSVTVEEPVDTRYVLTVDGTDYYFTEDYSRLNIPEGFAKITETVGDYEITLYTSPNELISCAYLTDEDGNNGAWYIVDLDAGTIAPFISVLSSYTTFIILEPDESVSIPDGYTTFIYDFSGNEVTACHYDETNDIILVYAMTADTEPAWYRYDTEMKTFVRYISDYQVNNTDTDNTDEDESFFEEYKIEILIGCAALFLIMLVVIIILAILLKKSKPKNDKDEDDDDFDDEVIFSPDGDNNNSTAAETAAIEEPASNKLKTDEETTDELPVEEPVEESAKESVEESAKESAEESAKESAEESVEEYPTLNTADLSEVFNMAENIVQNEGKEEPSTKDEN